MQIRRFARWQNFHLICFVLFFSSKHKCKRNYLPCTTTNYWITASIFDLRSPRKSYWSTTFILCTSLDQSLTSVTLKGMQKGSWLIHISFLVSLLIAQVLKKDIVRDIEVSWNFYKVYFSFCFILSLHHLYARKIFDIIIIKDGSEFFAFNETENVLKPE